MEDSSEIAEKISLAHVAVLDTQMLGEDQEVDKNFKIQESLGPEAYVLIVDASGASKNSLNKHIEEITGKGTPVFLVSKNPAYDTGIQRINYGSQDEAVNAGATPLKDVNFKGTIEVVKAVQNAARKGMHGNQIKADIVEKFGSPLPPPAKK